MFTLKFYRITDGGRVVDHLSCKHFSVYERDDGSYEIVTYQKNTAEEGVSRQVSLNDPVSEPLTAAFCWHYDHCYVENEAGKTIAHYFATREPKKAGLTK